MDLIRKPNSFWPEPGAATIFCWTLGVIDSALLIFLASRAIQL